MGVHWTLELVSILVIALGVYVSFGPYHDDRTWNLVRNGGKLEQIKLPQQEPTHFGLYSQGSGISISSPTLLFVPGHGGSWRQGINLCAYLQQEEAFNFYGVDFHASASGLHWSVIRSQASFTAAAIRHLSEAHPGPKLLLGHSMGGRVALEALKLLPRQTVDALILVSAPMEPHPLLLEPRFAPKAYDVSDLVVYSISGGATDPLVPMRNCRVERSLGRFIPLPAASNVYSSFSHVNLLFSRHSLHFLSRLLLTVAMKGEVPMSPWLRLSSFSVARLEDEQPKELRNVPLMDPVELSLVSTEILENEQRLWLQPKIGGVFSFLLLEESRPIRRRPETTTRGETFDATDVLNCNQVHLTWRHQGAGEWNRVPLIDMQFPAKVCLFQLRPNLTTATEVLLSPRPQQKKMQRRKVWAHWHEDPIEAPLRCSPIIGGLLGWFQMLLWPLRCRLPAGRAAVSRLVLAVPQLPILAVDFWISEVSGRNDTKLKLPLILVSQAEHEEDVRVGALDLPASPARESFSRWATESQNASVVFAPRMTGERKEAVSIFVIGHADLDVTLEVRSNFFSALAEFFRTQRFHSWLGACTCFSAQDHSAKSRLPVRFFPHLWAGSTVLLQLILQVSVVPVIFVCVDVVIGLGLASASRRLALLLSAVCRRVSCSCCKGRRSRCCRNQGGLCARVMAVSLLVASTQPTSCLLLLIVGSVAICGAVKDSPLLGTSSLLLGPHLLCELPSIIFAVWLMAGQQQRASVDFMQPKLEQNLRRSQHMASLWADSWLFPGAELRRVLSLLIPSVTLCCCLATGGSSSPHPHVGPAMLVLSVLVTIYAATSSSRLWWACQPVLIAHMLLAVASWRKQAKLE